jgi:hypothetical protein
MSWMGFALGSLSTLDIIEYSKRRKVRDVATGLPMSTSYSQPRRHKVATPPRERGTIEDAIAITGLNGRTVQAMAARGEIPGAGKMARRWTFDLSKLRHYVADRERETWQKSHEHRGGVFGGVTVSGVGLRSEAETSNGRFTQIIRRSRANVAKRAKNVP